MACPHPKRDYFYSVYTNKRICRHCWVDEDPTVEEPMTLQTTTTLTAGTPTPEEVFDNVIDALVRLNEAAQRNLEILAEFNVTWDEARDRGIGVLVVRKRDGSITSTANMFVPAGTAIFMDEPGDWSQTLRQEGYRFEEPIERGLAA